MRDIPDPGDSEGIKLSSEARSPVRFAGLVLDLDACTLAHEFGEPIALTRGEFALLRVFVSRPGRVLSRDALLDAVANRPLEPFDRSVDVLVGGLRRKIEPDPKAPRLIVTAPGEGYRFDGLAPALQLVPSGARSDDATADDRGGDRAAQSVPKTDPQSIFEPPADCALNFGAGRRLPARRCLRSSFSPPMAGMRGSRTG